jgi:hypothetical protein
LSEKGFSTFKILWIRAETVRKGLALVSRPTVRIICRTDVSSVSASSAAPFYLPLIWDPNLGPLSDGGLSKNNPFEIAAIEIQAVDVGRNALDYILSVGTGLFLKHSEGTSWPQRIKHAFFAKLEPDRIYWESPILQSPRSFGRLFRLDPTFHVPEIPLDDAKTVSKLAHDTTQHLRSDGMTLRLIEEFYMAFIGSSFYMQLTERPKFKEARSEFFCKGKILLRWQENDAIRHRFREKLINDSPYALCIPLPISFFVKTLRDLLKVEILLANNLKHLISGMPQSIRSLILLQGQQYSTLSRKRKRS